MSDRKSIELQELLNEFFVNFKRETRTLQQIIVEKRSSKMLANEFEKNLHDCFLIRNGTVRVKNGKPHYGQITIDVIKKFIDTNATVVDENLINELSVFLANQTPSFELLKNQIELSDMIRFLENSFDNKYRFTTKYGAVRVMLSQKSKLNREAIESIRTEFLDSLSKLSHGSTASYKLMNPDEAAEYSGRYQSATIFNFGIPGFEVFKEFVVTFAFGKGDSIEKETQQLKKLKDELYNLRGKKIIINGKSFGPYTDVIKATDTHAKADIVFTGPKGNLYVSLKDGKTPKDHQQWGGVLKDTAIMNDPRTVEFFKKCMLISEISVNEQYPNTFDVKLKKPRWGLISTRSVESGESDFAETTIELKAMYGRDAHGQITSLDSNKSNRKQKIAFGENFCQFVIQSSVEGLKIAEDGTLKADGKIIQWPNLPDEDYKPIFYARSDNSSAIELKGKWIEAFKEAIETSTNRENKKELLNKLNEIGNNQIKIRGARFLIYPFGKKNPGDKDIDEPIKESTLITLNLLNELFTEAKNNSHPSAYKAPQGSERDKQLDQTQADLKSGDPQRIQRAYRRRERMEKQARSQPGWKNRPRQDTQSESHEPSQESQLFEAMQTLLEALSKKLKATLRKKALKRGLTPGSVESEYKKGLAAYASSGSRPGMTAHQWAMARVNAATPSKKWATVKKSKGKKKK